MHTRPATNPYQRHRFPAEIISHGIWLSCRFCLSDRDVAELTAECSVILTYEAVRSIRNDLADPEEFDAHRAPRS